MPLDPMEFSLTGRDKVACKDCPVAPAPVEGEPPVEPAICPTCGGKKVVLVEHDYLCKPHRPDAGIRVAAGVAALAAEPLAALAKSAVREMDLFELVESDAGMPLVMDAIGRLDSEAIGAAFRHALDVLDPALMRAILANTWATYLFLRKAPAVLARIGAIGTKVVNKLMGLILAAVAMQFLINGVKALYIEMRQAPPAAIVSTK